MDFKGVKRAAKPFVGWANEELQENSSEVESVPDEMSNDEPLTVPEKEFEVKDHSVILDTVAASIHKCFSTSGKLYNDLAALIQDFSFPH